MVIQEVDGRTNCGVFIQRPGTTYFHILWKTLHRDTADASWPKVRDSTVRDSDQPPPYEPVEFKESWINIGSGVWHRKLEHCHSTQWAINTHKQDDKSSGPDPNPNLTFTCRGMLRQPKHTTQAALDVICRSIAQSLFSHQRTHKCTCDLHFLRLGRVDLASNHPTAHRCSDSTLRRERKLQTKTVLDQIRLHDALCYCCCFSGGIWQPTRLSSPRPCHYGFGATKGVDRETRYRYGSDGSRLPGSKIGFALFIAYW